LDDFVASLPGRSDPVVERCEVALVVGGIGDHDRYLLVEPFLVSLIGKVSAKEFE
jgi:hypothetical protein